MIDEHLRRWSALHGGLRPSALVRRWLGFVQLLATPLRRVPPGALTLGGFLVAVGVPLVCLPGGRWPLLGAALVVCSGVLDSLDGAVAALAGRATGLGAVLDALADRCADTAYLLALWVLGAPGWLVGLGAGLAALQEYVRARAATLGMPESAVLTVWERPTRVLLAAFLLLGCGLLTGHADSIATAGAAAALGLGLLGLGQLGAAARRTLAGPS